MHILLSNDDGYLADGLVRLAARLRARHRVTVVAPDRNRSAVSNALTLARPLRVTSAGDGVFHVDGTPTDCVHLAVTGLLLGDLPDMVISGINHGPNMGDDVMYSGTVAAAIEGRHLGLPAMAISMADYHPVHWDAATDAVASLVDHLDRFPVDGGSILNVNVPHRVTGDVRGFRATRLGHRHAAEPVIPAEDPRGERIWWVGPPGAVADAGEGTDFAAVEAGYVSVTPLQIDMTRQTAVGSVGGWLESWA